MYVTKCACGEDLFHLCVCVCEGGGGGGDVLDSFVDLNKFATNFVILT